MQGEIRQSGRQFVKSNYLLKYKNYLFFALVQSLSRSLGDMEAVDLLEREAMASTFRTRERKRLVASRKAVSASTFRWRAKLTKVNRTSPSSRPNAGPFDPARESSRSSSRILAGMPLCG